VYRAFRITRSQKCDHEFLSLPVMQSQCGLLT